VEGGGGTRLAQFAARLAGNGRMIQISPTMRILVAIEPVDLRKYAPSIKMRSCAYPGHAIARFYFTLDDLPGISNAA
jgi:hypothetical protein